MVRRLEAVKATMADPDQARMGGLQMADDSRRCRTGGGSFAAMGPRGLGPGLECGGSWPPTPPSKMSQSTASPPAGSSEPEAYPPRSHLLLRLIDPLSVVTGHGWRCLVT